MAAVVVTPTIVRKSVWGDRRVVTASLAFDTGDYAAGGIAVTPAMFGLQVLEEVIPMGAASAVTAATTGLLAQWNAADSKIRLYEGGADGDAFDEKPAEAMGSGANVRVLAIGY